MGCEKNKHRELVTRDSRKPLTSRSVSNNIAHADTSFGIKTEKGESGTDGDLVLVGIWY